MNDVYSPPQSELLESQPNPTENAGSLQKGIDGDFEFDISDILSEAWDLCAGHRMPLLAAGAIYLGISILSNAISAGAGALAGDASGMAAIILGTVIPMCVGIISYPLLTGMFLYCITHAAGKPVSFDIFLSCYNRTFLIFGAAMLTMIMGILGFLCLIIPGIYLSVAYGLALPLMVEKNLGIWEAMEGSRKAITNCWFRYFGFTLVLGLIVLVSMIPLGIGLFWTVPFSFMAMGVAYRQIFGFEGA